MRRGLFIGIAIAIFICLNAGLVTGKVSAQETATSYPTHMALLIGNSDYNRDGRTELTSDPASPYQNDLPNPRADVATINKVLGNTYLTTTVYDLDLAQMRAAIEDFAIRVREADQMAEAQGKPKPVVLIYYAGHGMEINGQNILIPVMAQMPDFNRLAQMPSEFVRSNVGQTALYVDELLEYYAKRRSAVTLVVIDACRNSAWSRRARNGTRSSVVEQGLVDMRVTGAGAVIVLTSAQPGAVASDGPKDGLSPFASAFRDAKAKRQPFDDFSREISNRVERETGGNQRPQVSGFATTKFCLLRCDNEQGGKGKRRGQDRPVGYFSAYTDEQVWLYAARFDTSVDYEIYLHRFPAGLYAEQAFKRLNERLVTESKAPPYGADLPERAAAIISEFSTEDWNQVDERFLAEKVIAMTSLKQLEGSAEMANARAQALLGIAHYFQLGGAVLSPEKAEQWLQRSAMLGDYVGQTYAFLVSKEEHGLVATRNDEKYKTWLTLASDQGYSKALLTNFRVYHYPSNASIFSRLAAESQSPLVIKSGELGWSPSQNRLAMAYYWASRSQLSEASGKDNLEKAYQWATKAADQGDITAAINLNSISQRLNIRIDHLRLLKGALQGDANAQYSFAFYLENRRSVKPDITNAIFWYEKSASQENGAALRSLVTLYIDGRKVDRNVDKVIALYQSMTEWQSSYSQSLALRSLAELYLTVPEIKDPTRAYDYYVDAADKGDTDSMVALYRLLRDGKEFERNPGEALRWVTLAAEHGNDGRIELGLAYEAGDIVEKSPEKAFEQFEAAAEDDDDYGYNLGRAYENGIGTSKDMIKAAAAYLAASDWDDDAKRAMVRFYRNGLGGIAKDETKAKELEEELE